jgi:hypothetical protein
VVRRRRTATGVGGAALLLGAALCRAGDLGSVTGFDVFAENHPSIAADLQKHPSLVHDPDYMRRHPGLVAYLRSTPLARMELDEEADAEVPPLPPHAADDQSPSRRKAQPLRPLVPTDDE